METPLRGPLAAVEFLIMEFDSRNARLAVLNNVGYSAKNRGDAVEDARKAAEAAQARGLPLSYTVVRIASEDTFPA